MVSNIPHPGVRAAVGELCSCSASRVLHRHVTYDGKESWRALAREDHEAAKAQLLKEMGL